MVIVNGKKAIQEALVTKSIDFADRPEPFQPWAVYPPAKGIYGFMLSRYVAYTCIHDRPNICRQLLSQDRKTLIDVNHIWLQAYYANVLLLK